MWFFFEFLFVFFGLKDCILLVLCEMGVNGILCKMFFLFIIRYESWKCFEMFVEIFGIGKLEKDEFEVLVGSDEKLDVVMVMNVGFDVVL